VKIEKDTIMGQVLHQVNEDKKNANIIEKIHNLINSIEEEEYEFNDQLWTSSDLIVTDKKNISSNDELIIITEYAYEFSWLVYKLNAIYCPNRVTSNRLFTTIGFLFDIYMDKYEDIMIVLKMVILVSLVWLHPDHIGQDKFLVHPIDLPNFGKEF